jgi:hypothetical protein
MSFHLTPHHLGVPSSVPKMIFEPIARLAQIAHLSCVDINTISKKTKLSFYVTLSPRRSIRWGKKDFMPVVYSVQIVHLPCIEINTICKQIETSFHLTHITKEFHRVHRKRFPSILHFRSKPCTYLGSRLTLSPSGSKHAST